MIIRFSFKREPEDSIEVFRILIEVNRVHLLRRTLKSTVFVKFLLIVNSNCFVSIRTVHALRPLCAEAYQRKGPA